MAETPAPFEPDRPDLALVQLRRVREAARERGEACLLYTSPSPRD